MPTATSGLYEVILDQSYGTEKVKNVFHYLHTLGDDDLQDLCGLAFDEDVMAGLAALLNVVLTFDEIRCANITGELADVTRIPSENNGDVTGDASPAMVACSFRYQRTTKETRNGGKRFCGMVEGNINVNTFESAYFTAMQAVATTLATDISTVGGIFSPVILRKPDIEGVWLYNDVANVIALNRVTTQNSRKFF